jgi:hypothetical protein
LAFRTRQYCLRCPCSISMSFADISAAMSLAFLVGVRTRSCLTGPRNTNSRGLRRPRQDLQEIAIEDLRAAGRRDDPSFPDRMHVVETTLDYAEIRESLVEGYGSPPVDWILHGKRIYSFRDISMPPFRDVIEEGSEDTIATSGWIDSDGDVTRRLFVQLLNRTLSEMVHEPLAFWRDKRYLFFKLARGKQTRSFSYRSFENQTSRKVVKAYKRNGETNASYFRHDAFHPNFVRFGGEWYLAIEPTYHFTSDGYHEFRYSSDRMSGIKRLETNQSVRGHIGMWTAFLVRQPDLLRKDPLVFEALPGLPHPFGVPDNLWRENEDDDEKKRMEKAQYDLF